MGFLDFEIIENFDYFLHVENLCEPYVLLTENTKCFSIWIEKIEKILHVNLYEPYIKMFYFLDFER